MKSKSAIGPVLLGSLLMLTFTLAVRAGGDGDDQGRGFGDHHAAPLKVLGTITIPGIPIASTDIAFVDQQTERLYFADRSNAGVDVVDAENDVYLGRVTTGVGGAHFSGPLPKGTGGPNGVMTTPDKRVWAGDGDTTVKVADVDPASPNYLKIIAVIDVHSTIPGNTCTSGASGTCLRADEMAYDPAHNIVAVATDSPTSVPPYLTFINASYPYNILGQMNFAAQGEGTGTGLEQPAWDPEIHRFLQTLPANNPDGTGSIAIVDPVKETVDRVISLDAYNCSPSGEALGPDQHVVVACAIPGASAPSRSTFPLVLDVSTGDEIGPGIDQVGGGDEVNYNPGDNRFIVSSSIDGISTNPGVLGVINAATGDWLQNVPPAGMAPRSSNLAAFGEVNHVFVVVHPATVPDICPTVGVVGTGGAVTQVDYGCVAVFGPIGEDPDNFHF